MFVLGIEHRMYSLQYLAFSEEVRTDEELFLSTLIA